MSSSALLRLEVAAAFDERQGSRRKTDEDGTVDDEDSISALFAPDQKYINSCTALENSSPSVRLRARRTTRETGK
jgi:hypothetical protein